MKCLGYRLNLHTPFSFMEVLLEVLGHNEPQVDVRILRAVGVKLLECFHCQRGQIYDRLYESMTGRSRDASDRQEFAVIERNLLYLAASVVVAAGYLYDHAQRDVHKLVGWRGRTRAWLGGISMKLTLLFRFSTRFRL